MDGVSSQISEIPLVEIEGADEPLRIMTKEQIRERDRLNVEVTASSIRRRVLSKQNGRKPMVR